MIVQSAVQGAGLVAAGKLDAEPLNAVLDDPAIRAAADEVRAELAALPGPAEAVATLVDYARFSVT